LSKITLGNNSKNLDTVSFIYDFNPQQQHANINVDYKKTLGSQLCDLLIKQFDKHCLNEQSSNLKLSIYNTLRALLVLSIEAKHTALDGKTFFFLLFVEMFKKLKILAGFIETLVEHLKDTHAKLNLKALNCKLTLKVN
jgi:hypothetical protein